MSYRQDQTSSNSSERIGEYVSIYLRGSKWCVNFMEGGRQHRVSLKTTSKKQAHLNALKIENRLLVGEREPRKDVAAKELIQGYRDHVQSGSLATTTKRKYLRVLDAVLYQAEELRDASDLDFSFLDRFRTHRLKQVSELTTYDECVIILQMTKFGERRKLISRNPLAGYPIKKPKPNPQPCWTREEGEQIVANAPFPYRIAFLVLLDTGMRSAELTHLQWADMDFQHNVIHVRGKTWTENAETQTWRPKTGDQRVVPMTPQVKTELRTLRRRNEWVFLAPASPQYPAGDHRLTENRLLKALKPVLKKLSLPRKVHTFRHTFISVALTNGIPVATVQAWAGHLDVAIIKLYTHVADQVSQQQMEQLAAKLQPREDEAM